MLMDVNDITANRCKYLKIVRTKLLEHFSRILPTEPSKSRRVTQLGRPQSKRDLTETAAEYYADNILNPIPLKEIITLISKSTVLVDIVPHNAFQSIMTNLLESTITFIPLYKRGQKHTIQSFLEGIGDLYNVGLQPQIANLYPPVQFPVSRGTPMISPLIKWDHSEDYYVFRYKEKNKIFSTERIITITPDDEDFEYMYGHVIDERILLPVTSCLYEIWRTIGSLNGTDHKNIPIVFENIKFVRATHLSKRDKLELTLVIQESNNTFQILEKSNVVVSGIVRLPNNIAKERLQFLAKSDDAEECMNTSDIYKKLRVCGYQYTGWYRSLKSASINGSVGHIKWSSNWVAFIDNMVQMKSLSLDSRNVIYITTQIRKLVIDPEFHIRQLPKLSIEERNVPVRIYGSLDAIVSGGIEIYGQRFVAISRRPANIKPVHEEYKFIGYRDHTTISLKDAVQISIQIALECHELRNVKVIEVVEDDDKILLEDLITPIIHEVLSNLPLVQSNLTLVATKNRFHSSLLPENLLVIQPNNVLKDDTFLMVIGVGILTKDGHTLLSNVMAGGFLFTREDLNATYDNELLQQYNLNIILEKRTERESVLLLRKTQNVIMRREVVYINNYEFSWIIKLKSVMEVVDETNSRITLVAEGDPESGVLGFVNCLRREPGGKTVRCVFIQDEHAPKFSLQAPFYMNHLLLDLPMNVLRPGKVWGSYRHLPLPPPEPVLVQCGYVTQAVGKRL
ncbi:Fatty acid synthase [Harpegnathos saltator]|uniref:Fatty acid synthase n=1 Tax=Harpegnathos saltator TaxID=610380 RepID=E2C8B1_HARSA|nr:Fatty acid synthase [Harpegnathos saltator]